MKMSLGQLSLTLLVPKFEIFSALFICKTIHKTGQFLAEHQIRKEQ